MPTKKSKKAAKKPGKAAPGKVGQKVAAPKKAARPLHKPSPMIATSKVPVKSNKPVPKAVAAKATRVKIAPLDADSDDQNADKLAPIKFDTRPLVLPTRPAQNDDDEVDPSSSASLLAGPR